MAQRSPFKFKYLFHSHLDPQVLQSAFIKEVHDLIRFTKTADVLSLPSKQAIAFSTSIFNGILMLSRTSTLVVGFDTQLTIKSCVLKNDENDNDVARRREIPIHSGP